MTIGERIRTARIEAGLSQRELAGELITRNMLSLLEHDQANPSLETLRELAHRLHRPVSYFLGEDVPQLPGLETLRQARSAFAAGEYERCRSLTGEVPDGEVLQTERELLWAQATLRLAEQALVERKQRWSVSLLQDGNRFESLPLAAQELNRQRKLLLARAEAELGNFSAVTENLPDADEILLLRAQSELHRKKPARAAELLDAAEHRDGALWNLLRGQAHQAAQAYEQAVECYHRAEKEYPSEACRGLQLSYAALRNFEKAYEYAVRNGNLHQPEETW